MKKFLNTDEIFKHIKPFDLIFFKGTDIVSRTIIDVECFVELHKTDKFSHVGIVLDYSVLPIPNFSKHKLYIWESTCSYTFDGILGNQPKNIITNTGYFGVQVRELKEVIKSYIESGGEVAWGKLINNPWEHKSNRKHIRKKILKLFIQNDLKPYDDSLLDLFASAFPCLRGEHKLFYEISIGPKKLLSLVSNKIDPKDYYDVETRKLFCSELVALILREFNLIPENVEPWDVTPMDLVGERNLHTVVYDPIYFKLQ